MSGGVCVYVSVCVSVCAGKPVIKAGRRGPSKGLRGITLYPRVSHLLFTVY